MIEKVKDSAKIAGIFTLIAVIGSFLASMVIESSMDDIRNNISFGFQAGHDVIIDIIKFNLIYPLAAGVIVFSLVFALCLWVFSERMELSN